jgi:hypothetical protein
MNMPTNPVDCASWNARWRTPAWNVDGRLALLGARGLLKKAVSKQSRLRVQRCESTLPTQIDVSLTHQPRKR